MTRSRFTKIALAQLLAMFMVISGTKPTHIFAQESDWPELPTAPVTGGIRNKAIGNLGNNPALAETGGTFLFYFVVLWRAVINLGALIVVVNFIWGAIDWITAGGDSGKIQKARDKITQSVIGLVLLVGSFVIIAFIGKVLFGNAFQILDLTFPNLVNFVPSEGETSPPFEIPGAPGEIPAE